MDSYYLWTIGCQMNRADSDRLAGALEQMGLQSVSRPEQADVIVLNSCVVRQGAEDRVVGSLTSLKPLKMQNPNKVLALMGCMVGPKQDELKARYPYVDFFLPPQQFDPLLDMIGDGIGVEWHDYLGPILPAAPTVSCYVPIIKGCDLMCTFCIIPYRRGRQVSRPMQEVVTEVEMLVGRGVKEVTLLGQTVDAYGHDLADRPDLADLLQRLNDIDGLDRIRFLTSHPIFLSKPIIEAVAGLEKVCEHINLPVQAGDDEVLARMRRRYTRDEYRRLVDGIRAKVPGVALSTDIIVGFPGETVQQFQRTLDLVREVGFDKVHSAMYSERSGTIAHRQQPDDVPQEEKTRRVKELDSLQEELLTQRNASFQRREVEVLVEERQKGRWQGRTRGDKLVFFDDDNDWTGQLVNVEVTKTSPWSLQGRLRQPELGSSGEGNRP